MLFVGYKHGGGGYRVWDPSRKDVVEVTFEQRDATLGKTCRRVHSPNPARSLGRPRHDAICTESAEADTTLCRAAAASAAEHGSTARLQF